MRHFSFTLQDVIDWFWWLDDNNFDAWIVELTRHLSEICKHILHNLQYLCDPLLSYEKGTENENSFPELHQHTEMEILFLHGLFLNDKILAILQDFQRIDPFGWPWYEGTKRRLDLVCISTP